MTHIKKQASALNFPFYKIQINKPYKKSYINALTWFKKQFGIDYVVTGDIDQVNRFPNWIQECCNEIQINTFFPLWNLPRRSIWQQIIDLDLDVRISYVSSPALQVSWLGRKIDTQVIEELEALHNSHGIDICGENGEFHTIVLNVHRILDIRSLPSRKYS